MVRLYDKKNSVLLGKISDEQFQILSDQLEEGSPADDDYYINQVALEMIQQAGGDANLMTLLRNALGDQEDVEIRWAKED